MPALYAASDIFMLASDFGEGTSVAQIEAMAIGPPVAVTSMSATMAWSPRASVWSSRRDCCRLGRGPRVLVADPGLRVRAGQAAAACAGARFGADRLYAGVAEFHEALLAGSSPPAPRSATPP